MNPLVGLIMGSDSDWPTVEPAAEVLADFGIPFEVGVVSAHRTPERMLTYAKEAHTRGLNASSPAPAGRTPTRHGGGSHPASRDWHPTGAERPRRHGLAALHRANAGRRARGHRLHWWCEKRWPAGRADSSAGIPNCWTKWWHTRKVCVTEVLAKG